MTIADAYQMTSDKPTNIILKLPTAMVTEISAKNAPTPSSELPPRRSGPQRPYITPNQEMPKSANAMYKAALREQKRTPITVNMTTYCEAYMLDMYQ